NLQDRGHSFVCAFCRQKLARSAVLSCQARSLSRTTCLSNSAKNEGPPGAGGFPGAFSNAGAGGWGTFARAETSSGVLPSTDGLLPHERQARQKSAAAETAQTTKSNEPKRNSGNQRNNTSQVTKSRSVLADVFKTSREPRAPPTPDSWTSPQPEGRDTANKPSRLSIPGKTFARQGAASGASPATSTSGGLKATGWNTFSNRKPETPVHTHGVDARGNQSGVWSEITKGRKPIMKAKVKLGVKPHAHGHEPKPPAGQPASGQEPVRQDFWGELETRATGLRDRAKSKNDSQPADRRKRNSQETRDKTELLSDTARSTTKVEDDVAPEKQRRKSRFELDEEEDQTEKSRSKKAKKPQKSRQAFEDEDWDDEAVHRWEQKQRRKAEKEAQKQMAIEEEQQAVPIFLPEYISASNLSRALKQHVGPFLQDMEEMGFENVTSDTIFTGETAALIAMEYGFEPTVDTGSQRDLRPRPPPEDPSVLPSRPPVVTIMGHVDHGKTTLLDWLRKSSVAAQEHGGITQHIGAFVVKMSSGKSITFLDTPGHAAFLSMRQRGANVTDIVVLVVAADDSVKPQTLEALKHATSAKVPIIVAITKVDKEDARIEQVKADLSRHGVEIEDYGGDVQVVCVSGKTGQGMEDLEENIVTLSEILDVRAEDDGMAEGWVLESSIKPQGKAATILVKRGTLRPGDLIVAGKTWAKIRVLRNEAGLELDSAPPGTPVEILGWRELPTAGEQVIQSPDEAKAKTAVEYRMEMAEREQSSIQLAEQEQRQREKAAADAAAEGESGPTTAGESTEPGVLTQNFIVKADVVGSVEAVCGTILELGSHEVRPKILRSSAGQITESDIDHAATSNSIIVNFNCTIPPHIKQRAEEAKVKILDHKVIYHVVDDVKAALSDILPMNVSFRVHGEAEVLQVFPINLKKRVFRNIAGCRVRNGSIKKSSRVKVLRRGEVIYDGKIDTLKHVKKDVQEMGKGTECGIGLEGFEDFQPEDQIQTYEEIKERRYL
ncbi:initiation factor 2, partial [Trichoderma reesei RUT C-30]